MNDKIKISGTPPAWDDTEYQRRLTLELHKYRNTRDCMEFIHTALEHDFYILMIEKHNQGYRLNKHYPASHDQLSHAIYMTKPDEQQQADIEKLKEKVKEEYVAHLESERARYQDLLRQQLIQTQQEKELKALQEKQAKQLAAIEKQVQDCYAPLEIPE